MERGVSQMLSVFVRDIILSFLGVLCLYRHFSKRNDLCLKRPNVLKKLFASYLCVQQLISLQLVLFVYFVNNNRELALSQ